MLSMIAPPPFPVFLARFRFVRSLPVEEGAEVEAVEELLEAEVEVELEAVDAPVELDEKEVEGVDLAATDC